jgi:hypothetical protein
VPRSALTNGHAFDDLVCDDCLEWFERRRRVSGTFPKIERS